MKFIHLTDPHLVPAGERLYGLDPEARLRAAVADINKNQPDAAFVLATGDLTHRGKPAAYNVLRRALEDLTVPWHLMLGNHDDRQAFRDAFPEVPTDEHGFIQSVVETPAGPLVLLDTNQPGTAAGWFCDRRIAWLDRTLAALKGERAMLAMHHPPFDVALPALDAIGLVQKAELGAVLAKHPVRHIFFGHVHRPIHGAWRDIPFSTLRALNHQVALQFTLEGGEGGRRRVPGSHEPPAYSIVLADRESIVIHVHDFLDASPRFYLSEEEAQRARSVEELEARTVVSE
ncbi:phosphodiesterase [Dongia deserti]|uniref:phosphodiesterase n=1 Tax=Dongia deserti TaxID=2268030 RepID=UPI000E64B8CB|nr:phosphodiesterase [Dongia deserti]